MRDYRSPGWQAVKARMIEMAEGRCERCGKSRADGAVLQVHHHKYRPGARVWEYGIEELEVVCKGCHAVEHGIIRPWWGWAEDSVENLWPDTQDCDVCGTTIQHVHSISRPGWGSLEVGSDCAERMCSDGRSEPEDLEIRRRVARRRTFLASPRWQVEDRRHTIVQKSIEIELCESGGEWRIRVLDQLGKRSWPDALSARSGLFTLIDDGKLYEWVQRQLGRRVARSLLNGERRKRPDARPTVSWVDDWRR